MKIYLVRHGDALSEYEDPAQPLSPEGRHQVERVAECLAHMRVRVGKIECSTKRRAFETAQILARHLGCIDKLTERQGLKPNDPLDPLWEDLQKTDEDRILVGHLPYMEHMASALLGGGSKPVNFAVHPATCICLSGRMGSPFVLEWMIRPEMF
ncbi:MAG: phosphohistidine phosphatase SixA [Planctomycetes bacterium]|nr:phosphohistidine phosphatase SixA [Planctomycetota bacterium]